MLEVWRNFNHFLEAKVETDVESADAVDQTVQVTFTVTNKASPPEKDSPEILFEAVNLVVKRPDHSQIEEDLGQLSPGESASFKLETSYAELLDLEYEVQGTVSPSVFMTVRRGGKLPGDSLGLSISAYIQLFDESKVHQWFQSTIRAFPVPDPSTTLAGIAERRELLKTAHTEIEELATRLSHVSGLIRVDRHEREKISAHQREIGAYFREIRQAIGNLQSSLNSNDVRVTSDAQERAIEQLGRSASHLDAATDALRVAENA